MGWWARVWVGRVADYIQPEGPCLKGTPCGVCLVKSHQVASGRRSHLTQNLSTRKEQMFTTWPSGGWGGSAPQTPLCCVPVE